MAWSKNGTTTLSSAGDTVTVSSLTASDFNVFLFHGLSSGAITINLNMDNNSASDYALRENTNGTGESTKTNLTTLEALLQTSSSDGFVVMYCANIDGEEKLLISNSIRNNTAGASNAPNRREIVGKCDTTTNSGQFTRIDANNSGAGDYDTDSNLSALGTN